MVDDERLSRLAADVGAHLAGAGRRVALAESCTGGWIAKAITDVSGSSAWFDRGWVAYSNSAKEALGVSAATLAGHGAVSEAVVVELARGALAHSHADVAVAVSGIAGPDGGTVEKPVGLVWFAWATRDGSVRTSGRTFTGDREAVRRAAVAEALEGLLDAGEM